MKMCNVCYGQGEVKMSKKELKHYLGGLYHICLKVYFPRNAYKKMMLIYRQWKSRNRIVCDQCAGTGTWNK